MVSFEPLGQRTGKPPDMPEKKTELLTIWLPESLVNDLARMGHDDNRKPANEIDDVAMRGDSHQ